MASPGGVDARKTRRCSTPAAALGGASSSPPAPAENVVVRVSVVYRLSSEV